MLSKTLKALRHAKKMTLEELAEKVGTSKQTIHRYESGVITNVPPERIEALAAALGVTPAMLMGWQEDLRGVRGILPVHTKRVRMMGRIACGEPVYTNEEHDCYVCIDGRVDADFCLRASGDSMIGARIYDGDIVFIKAQDMVENGEIGAVVIGDEATLKRVYYYKEQGKLVLSPENPRYEPLVYIGEELNTIQIIGKAVAFQSMLR